MTVPVWLIAALFPVATLAANNWTVPCHAGECRWDLKSSHASGTMLLSGSNSSISDLTTAGGWTILNCNATSADQEIRAICHDPSKCDHLHLNGAENTVVRLPNDCSSEPFAVVTRVWNHTDQSIPASKHSWWKHRGRRHRSVQGIALSTNFTATNASHHGNITVFVSGSSMPAVIPTQDVPVVNASQACNASSVSLSARSSRTTKSGVISLPDMAFDTNLLDASISCPQSGDVPAFNGTVVVDLQSNVSASLNYDVSYKTILSIPDLSSLTLNVGFDADLESTLSLNADLTGGLTTGNINLYSVGLPGLDFGSIFKLGPTFTIFADADAVLDTKLDMDVGLAFTISGGQLVFPPSSSQGSGGLFSPGTSNIKLSASPNVTGNASLVAHLKPTVDFGVSILGHTSGIYLDLDAFAELDLSLTAAANGSVSAGTDGVSAKATDTGASGCVDISTGLAVDAGADLDLIIFKTGDNVTLFSKKFDLYNSCFGVGNEKRELGRRPTRRRALPGRSPLEEGRRKRHDGHHPSETAVGRSRFVQKRDDDGLVCPTVLLGALVSIVEAAVDAAT